jgi:hypothetical protein
MRSVLLVLFLFSTLVAGACVVDVALSDRSSQCARGEYCATVQYLGLDANGDVLNARDCRECDVASGGAQPSMGVYDALNYCNCGAGEFCRQTAPQYADQPGAVGVCERSMLVGSACNSSDDCEGVREHSLDGGYSRAERAYCHQGTCRQCDPTEFEAAHGSLSKTCPGYLAHPDGSRYYLSALPGVTMTCTASGDLVASGTVDWERKEGNIGGAAGTNNAEEEHMTGLMATSFVLIVLGLCCACAFATVVIVMLSVLVARTGNGNLQ